MRVHISRTDVFVAHAYVYVGIVRREWAAEYFIQHESSWNLAQWNSNENNVEAKNRLFFLIYYQKSPQEFVQAIIEISARPNTLAEKIVLKSMIAGINQQMAFATILFGVKLSGKCSVKMTFDVRFSPSLFLFPNNNSIWLFFGLISFDWRKEKEKWRIYRTQQICHGNFLIAFAFFSYIFPEF